MNPIRKTGFGSLGREPQSPGFSLNTGISDGFWLIFKRDFNLQHPPIGFGNREIQINYITAPKR